MQRSRRCRFRLIELRANRRFGLCLAAFVGLAFFGFPVLVFADQSDPTVLAAQVDRRIADRWSDAKITPAAVADDATFVRRVYLDLAGHIPSAAEVRTFLNDTSLEKRAKLVARLIDSAAHARHAAIFWRRQWVPQADTPQFALLADEVDGWLAGKLRDGVPYDRIVRDLITTSRTRVGSPDRSMAPTAFLMASEFKPENLAANTTRAFLGIRFFEEVNG